MDLGAWKELAKRIAVHGQKDGEFDPDRLLMSGPKIHIQLFANGYIQGDDDDPFIAHGDLTEEQSAQLKAIANGIVPAEWEGAK